MNIRITPDHDYSPKQASLVVQAITSHTAPSSEANQAMLISEEQTDLPSTEQDEQDHLLRQKALRSAQQGNYSDAIALLTRLIDRTPNSASHYNNRGLLHFQNGQLEQALVDYNHALQLNPRLAKAYNNRANCYASLGHLAEAIGDYETAIDLDPANTHAWINQGITFRDLEMYGQAIENFDLALRFSQIFLNESAPPNSSSFLEGHIYAERGRTYHLAGDWNCGIADYRRALAILPPSGLANTNISQRLRTQVQNWMNDLLEPMAS